METLNFKIRGVTPLLQHNSQLADPLNKYSKALKKVSSRRTKTEDDHIEMQRLEMLGGLYWRDDVGLHIPGENIEASLLAAAKFRKLGTTVTRGARVLELYCPLLKTGAPSTREEIADNLAFRYTKSVKVGKNRIMRTRPIFENWEAAFTLGYDPHQLQRDDLVGVAEDAGAMVGLGDYRPRFGQFEIVEVK